MRPRACLSETGEPDRLAVLAKFTELARVMPWFLITIIIVVVFI